MDDDKDRYDDAAGWDGSDSASKRRTKNSGLSTPDPGSSPFLVTVGTENSRLGDSKPVPQLFGSLWRAGETAVLFGDTGVGKSVLALQIAESIARGSKSGGKPFPCTAKPQSVLYIDFERSREQFGERYSAPSPIPGKLPVKHRLHKNLIRAHVDGIPYVPEVFKNKPHRFFLYWTYDEIEKSGARVAIIDNIAYLARTLSGGSGTSVMKTLRLWAADLNLSILAIAHRRPRKPHSVITLADLAAAPTVADLADSVFAIGGSTIAPDLRYIKHLKSRSAILEHDEQNVIVCQLGRSGSPPVREGVGEFSSPPGMRRGTDASSAGWSGAISRSPVSMSLVSSTPVSPTPFLGLHHIGFSDESIHLTDHVKKAQLADRLEREQLRRSKSVINTLMSREYKRYLER